MDKYETKKPYHLIRLLRGGNGFLECRGREIRTPDLLLPKQAENPL
jgi:hypothetical protein